MAFDNPKIDQPNLSDTGSIGDLQPLARQADYGRSLLSSTPRSTSGGGLGCALVGLVILVAVGLAGLALLLPPFSLGNRLSTGPYITLDGKTPNTTLNDLTLAIDPTIGTSSLAVRLTLTKTDVFNGQSNPSADEAAWVNTARAALPSTLTLLTPLYRIDQQGTASSVILSLNPPQGAPLASIDMFRYDVQAKRWFFVPSHPNGSALVATLNVVPDRVGLFLPSRLIPIVNTVIDVGQPLTPSIAGIVNVVHPSGLQPSSSGALQGVLPAGVETARSYGVVPVIRNFATPAAVDVATISTLLQNSGLRSAHIERIVEFASTKPYQGIAIDYRRLPADQRDNFTAFITELAQKLHNANLTLTVVVPFPTQDGSGFNTGAYDWRSIGTAADTIQMLMPLDPQIFADQGMIDAVIQWAIGEVNRARFQVALSTLSVQETSGNFTSVAFADTLTPLGQITVKPPSIVPQGVPIEANLTGYRAVFAPLDSARTPSIQYFAPDGTLAATMWLTTGTVFYDRLKRIGQYNIAGVNVVDLAAGGAPDDLLTYLSAYKLNQPTEATPVALSLHWTILANGKTIAEASTVPGTPFVYKPDVDSLQVGAQIVGANSTLIPVSVKVATPTASVPATTPIPNPTLQ